MKKYLLCTILFLTNCDHTTIGVEKPNPYSLNKYEVSITLNYINHKVEPENLSRFVQEIKKKRYFGRCTKYVFLPDWEAPIWKSRFEYIETHLQKLGLHFVKIRTTQGNSKGNNQQHAKVLIKSFEVEMAMQEDGFGYAYHVNILQNLNDVSSLFNETKDPVQVEAKFSTAAINKLYEESNVKESTQNNQEAGNKEDIVGNITEGLLSSIKGG